MAMLDFVWAMYARAVTSGTALQAANWSVLVFLLGALVTTLYVSAVWTAVPSAAGAWVGTFLAKKKRKL